MFYKLEPDKITEIQQNEIQKGGVVAAYIKLAELEDTAKIFDLSPIAVKECQQNSNGTSAALDVYDDFSFGIINIINLCDLKQKRDRVAIFLKKDLFIMVEIIDKDTSTADMFDAAIKRYTSKITLEKVIYGIMDRLLMGGSDRLNEIQTAVLELERRITNNKLDENTNKTLFKMKRNLVQQRNYYNQLVEVGEALEENENDIFSSDNLRYFGVFTARADRLAQRASDLCENLVHVREAYEAGINYNMNKTMQFFTVITAVFLPLTLIAGWYGMNFTNMPLISSPYGYPIVIIASAVIIVCVLVWFKKKKYM